MPSFKYISLLSTCIHAFIPGSTNFMQKQEPSVRQPNFYMPQPYEINQEILSQRNLSEFENSFGIMIYAENSYNFQDIDFLDNPYFNVKLQATELKDETWTQNIDDDVGFVKCSKSQVEKMFPGKTRLAEMKNSICLTGIDKLQLSSDWNMPSYKNFKIIFSSCRNETQSNCKSQNEIEEFMSQNQFTVLGVQTTLVNGQLKRSPYLLFDGPFENQGKNAPVGWNNVRMGLDVVQRYGSSENGAPAHQEFMNIKSNEVWKTQSYIYDKDKPIHMIYFSMDMYGTNYHSPIDYFEGSNGRWVRQGASNLFAAKTIIALMAIVGSTLY